MRCCVSSFFPYPPARRNCEQNSFDACTGSRRGNNVPPSTLVLAAGLRRLAKIPVTVKRMLMARFTDTSLPCYLSNRNLSSDRGGNSEETQDRLLHMPAEIDQQLVGGFKAD